MGQKQYNLVLSVILALAMLFSATGTVFAAQKDEKVNVTILQTSDTHGFLNAHDYATDSAVDRGFSKVSTLVKQERGKAPQLVLIDTGDNLQGNLVETFRNQAVHPVVKAMNYMGYDTYTLGNHEFNYEFSTLQNVIAKSNATVISSNIHKPDGTRFVEPYIIKEVHGVKVAIIGLTAPHVPDWEVSDPTRYNGMKFSYPMDEMKEILDEVEPLADLIIVAAHDNREPDKGVDGMYAIADAFGDRIDAIFIGHEHSAFTEVRNGVLIAEPGTEGVNVVKAVFELTFDGAKWNVTGKDAELLKTAGVEPDPGFVAEMKETHDASVALANTVVGTVGADFLDPVELLPGMPVVPLQDTALMDLVNKVQLLKSGADVSMAAGFDPSANLKAGDYLKKDGVKVYKYDNTLYGVKITGAQLKSIMELQAGNFYNQWKPGDVTISFNPEVRYYAFDMFAGVDYEIDISKPKGQRIINIIYKDAPLKDDVSLVLAINNHRYGNLLLAGYEFAADAIVYDSFNESGATTIRDMISEYVAAQKTIYPECDNNWKIVGYDLNDPQKDMIYEMIRNGEIVIELSSDKRTPNVKSINAIELREQGILPALDSVSAIEAPAVVAEPAVKPVAAPVDGVNLIRIGMELELPAA